MGERRRSGAAEAGEGAAETARREEDEIEAAKQRTSADEDGSGER